MLDLPCSHPWLEREIAGAGRELSQVSQFCGTGQPSACAGKFAPRWSEQALDLWEAFQRRERRHGDVPTTTSSSSARGSAGRDALPPPAARCAFPTAADCFARGLPTVCPADPVHRCRFAVKWASTSACCRSSASCASGTEPALDRALLPGDAAASARGGRRRRPRPRS